MTVRSRAKWQQRAAIVAFALAAASASLAAGKVSDDGSTRVASSFVAPLSEPPAWSETFTLEQLSRIGEGQVADFPRVVGSRNQIPTVRARFQQKSGFTLADGSRQTLFLFRATNCWLQERTATESAVIDCRGGIGPGVFIPVLFVTPASRPKSDKSSAPDLVLRSRDTSSLADYVPIEILDRAPPYGNSKALWVGLRNPASDSLALSAPAAPAALVLCVPVSSSECQSDANVPLANLAEVPDQAAGLPPANPTPAAPPPAPPAPPGGAAQPPPVPSSRPAEPQATRPVAPGPPPVVAAQLHYVIRPSASAVPTGWTAQRVAKRLVALLASTQSEFFMKTPDGVEVPSNLKPEVTGSGDAVVVWSGDNPGGASEFIFRGVDGLELLPWTQPAKTQPTASSLASPRIHANDFISFAEFKIAAPFLYDQWQASIEVVNKVYGRELPDSTNDACRFFLLIPRTGVIAFLTGPISIGLDRVDQTGRTLLLSRPEIVPSQLMHALNEPLRLEVQAANGDQACVAQTANLAAFAPLAAHAGTTWKLSSLPGNPSFGRMEIRTSNLMVPGRWLLGLYGPPNTGGGADAFPVASADLQDKILQTLTAFLDDFYERQFNTSQPASAAIGADLALIGAADAVSPTFSDRNVITGKLRQPPTSNGMFRLDPEGKRRLSAFLASPGNTGAEISFRAVGQMIRHYSDLFGNFSGQRPPIAIYVGSVHPGPGTCPEWKKVTADVAKLSGRPRAFGLVFANATADEIAQQLGLNSRGADEILGGQTSVSTCEGDSGSALLFVPFADLISQPPEAVLRPLFEVVERLAAKVQN
jgi:hypothetical protein